MGAETFTTWSTGPTAQYAFDRAVERAQYDHGHSGYTGTIAEKPSYVEIPADATETARLALNGAERLDRLANAGTTDTGPVMYQSVEVMRRQAVALRRTADTLLEPQPNGSTTRLIETIAELLLDLDDRRISDKWGPAGCLKGPATANGHRWLFFGWASS